MPVKRKKEQFQLEIFDRLQRVRRDEKGSIYRGERGLYIIRHLEPLPQAGRHSPLAKVILNSEFLTGLFRTKNRAIFSGDIREDSKRKFLLFKFEDNGEIEIKASRDC